MSQSEIDRLVVTENIKFDYSITTLIFATLALSLQFSPNLGNELPFVLIFAWISFLFAGISGGYNLMRTQHFYRTNSLLAKSKNGGDVEGVKIYESDMERFDTEMRHSSNIRNWLFLLGLCLNMVFAIVNYLHRVHCL